MQNNKITSLRKYRAQRYFDGYLSLPSAQRTDARSALLLEAIFEYAYENVPAEKLRSESQVCVTPAEARRISERLDEFIPPSVKPDREVIMTWLHENLVDEAWTYPQEMRSLMHDFLRES
jgi:hypothetical protein